MSKPKNYIEPPEFFRQTLESILAGSVSEELGATFYMLASRYVNHRNFVRYFHIRDDLIGAGVLACCRGYDKFRPNRNILTRDEEGNITHTEPVEWDGIIPEYHHTLHYDPFAFFTTVVRNAMIQVIKKEYNQRNIINAVKLENGLEADFGYTEMKKAQEDDEAANRENEEVEKLSAGNIQW